MTSWLQAIAAYSVPVSQQEADPSSSQDSDQTHLPAEDLKRQVQILLSENSHLRETLNSRSGSCSPILLSPHSETRKATSQRKDPGDLSLICFLQNQVGFLRRTLEQVSTPLPAQPIFLVQGEFFLLLRKALTASLDTISQFLCILNSQEDSLYQTYADLQSRVQSSCTKYTFDSTLFNQLMLLVYEAESLKQRLLSIQRNKLHSLSSEMSELIYVSFKMIMPLAVSIKDEEDINELRTWNERKIEISTEEGTYELLCYKRKMLYDLETLKGNLLERNFKSGARGGKTVPKCIQPYRPTPLPVITEHIETQLPFSAVKSDANFLIEAVNNVKEIVGTWPWRKSPFLPSSKLEICNFTELTAFLKALKAEMDEIAKVAREEKPEIVEKVQKILQENSFQQSNSELTSELAKNITEKSQLQTEIDKIAFENSQLQAEIDDLRSQLASERDSNQQLLSYNHDWQQIYDSERVSNEKLHLEIAELHANYRNEELKLRSEVRNYKELYEELEKEVGRFIGRENERVFHSDAVCLAEIAEEIEGLSRRYEESLERELMQVKEPRWLRVVQGGKLRGEDQALAVWKGMEYLVKAADSSLHHLNIDPGYRDPTSEMTATAMKAMQHYVFSDLKLLDDYISDLTETQKRELEALESELEGEKIMRNRTNLELEMARKECREVERENDLLRKEMQFREIAVYSPPFSTNTSDEASRGAGGNLALCLSKGLDFTITYLSREILNQDLTPPEELMQKQAVLYELAVEVKQAFRQKGQRDIEELKYRIEELTGERDGVIQVNNSLRDEQQSLKNQYKNLLIEKLQAEDSHTAHIKRLTADLNSTKSSLSSQLQQLQIDFDEYRKNTEMENKRIREEKNEMEAKLGENLKKEKRNADLKLKEIEELKIEKNRLETEKNRLEIEKNQLETEKSRLKIQTDSEISALRENLSIQELFIISNSSELISDFEGQQKLQTSGTIEEKLIKGFEYICIQSKKITGNSEEIPKEALEKQKYLYQRLEEIERIMVDLRMEGERGREEKKEVMGKMQEKERMCKLHCGELRGVKEGLGRSEEGRKRLEEKVKELNRDISQLTSELTALNQTYAQVQLQSQELIRTHGEEKEKMRLEFEEEKEKMRLEFEEEKEKVEELSDQKAALETKVDGMTRDLRGERNDKEEQKRNLEGRIEQEQSEKRTVLNQLEVAEKKGKEVEEQLRRVVEATNQEKQANSSLILSLRTRLSEIESLVYITPSPPPPPDTPDTPTHKDRLLSYHGKVNRAFQYLNQKLTYLINSEETIGTSVNMLENQMEMYRAILAVERMMNVGKEEKVKACADLEDLKVKNQEYRGQIQKMYDDQAKIHKEHMEEINNLYKKIAELERKGTLQGDKIWKAEKSAEDTSRKLIVLQQNIEEIKKENQTLRTQLGADYSVAYPSDGPASVSDDTPRRHLQSQGSIETRLEKGFEAILKTAKSVTGRPSPASLSLLEQQKEVYDEVITLIQASQTSHLLDTCTEELASAKLQISLLTEQLHLSELTGLNSDPETTPHEVRSHLQAAASQTEKIAKGFDYSILEVAKILKKEVEIPEEMIDKQKLLFDLIMELIGKCEEIRGICGNFGGEIEGKLGKFERNLEGKIEELEEKLGKMNRILENLKKSAKQKNSQLKTQIELKEQEKTELNHEKDTLNRLIESLNKQIEDLRSNLEEKSANLTLKNAEFAEKSREIATFQSAISAMNEKIREISDINLPKTDKIDENCSKVVQILTFQSEKIQSMHKKYVLIHDLMCIFCEFLFNKTAIFPKNIVENDISDLTLIITRIKETDLPEIRSKNGDLTADIGKLEVKMREIMHEKEVEGEKNGDMRSVCEELMRNKEKLRVCLDILDRNKELYGSVHRVYALSRQILDKFELPYEPASDEHILTLISATERYLKPLISVKFEALTPVERIMSDKNEEILKFKENIDEMQQKIEREVKISDEERKLKEEITKKHDFLKEEVELLRKQIKVFEATLPIMHENATLQVKLNEMQEEMREIYKRKLIKIILKSLYPRVETALNRWKAVTNATKINLHYSKLEDKNGGLLNRIKVEMVRQNPILTIISCQGGEIKPMSDFAVYRLITDVLLRKAVESKVNLPLFTIEYCVEKLGTRENARRQIQAMVPTLYGFDPEKQYYGHLLARMLHIRNPLSHSFVSFLTQANSEMHQFVLQRLALKQAKSGGKKALAGTDPLTGGRLFLRDALSLIYDLKLDSDFNVCRQVLNYLRDADMEKTDYVTFVINHRMEWLGLNTQEFFGKIDSQKRGVDVSTLIHALRAKLHLCVSENKLNSVFSVKVDRNHSGNVGAEEFGVYMDATYYRLNAGHDNYTVEKNYFLYVLSNVYDKMVEGLGNGIRQVFEEKQGEGRLQGLKELVPRASEEELRACLQDTTDRNPDTFVSLLAEREVSGLFLRPFGKT